MTRWGIFEEEADLHYLKNTALCESLHSTLTEGRPEACPLPLNYHSSRWPLVQVKGLMIPDFPPPCSQRISWKYIGASYFKPGIDLNVRCCSFLPWTHCETEFFLPIQQSQEDRMPSQRGWQKDGSFAKPKLFTPAWHLPVQYCLRTAHSSVWFGEV